MRHLETLQAHVTPFLNFYIEALEEAFNDINTFLDEQLESDHITNLVIGGIIAAPFAGTIIFVAMVMLSA